MLLDPDVTVISAAGLTVMVPVIVLLVHSPVTVIEYVLVAATVGVPVIVNVFDALKFVKVIIPLLVLDPTPAPAVIVKPAGNPVIVAVLVPTTV